MEVTTNSAPQRGARELGLTSGAPPGRMVCSFAMRGPWLCFVCRRLPHEARSDGGSPRLVRGKIRVLSGNPRPVMAAAECLEEFSHLAAQSGKDRLGRRCFRRVK